MARSASFILRHARAEELDELSNDAFLAQNLRDGQHQIGRCHGRLHFAGQFETDHLGHQHIQRLAKHVGFGLDAADAPADDAQAVDHRRVAIGADQRIGQGHVFAVDLPHERHFGEVFQIHLVHDANVRRHHAEIVERFLAPTQKLVPLAIAT